jgi:TATA-box binding protein (TBP) (component of TFIID and TFIIIB)
MSSNINIDKEWENFMTSGFEDDNSSDDEDFSFTEISEEVASADILSDFDYSKTPKASDIYISTKTKIAYLNIPIELKNVFWNIPLIPYAKPCNGVIKKQMKFNSVNTEELEFIKEKLKDEIYYEENIITSINNPTGRIKFKDIRKVSIGISKKDIMSYRSKKKSAFYNCFVLILRMKTIDSFKEYHVKIFNTGKLEIPGIQSEESFHLILQQIIETLQPHIKEKLSYKENTNETVLINSNFNCGYFINRESLYDILKFKYNIQSIYDPCSYPGIQCKFYYNSDIGIQTGSQISEENKSLYKNIQQVSFMIFRTGSVLIVGKCDEKVLLIIYEFLKGILTQEFTQIRQKNIKVNENNVTTSTKEKRKKIRRKNIIVTTDV